MATKKQLQDYIKFLNYDLCRNTKNHFVVTSAYGGYGVSLTGKKNKNGSYKKGSLRSGHYQVTNGHQSSKNTIEYLYNRHLKGYLKADVKRVEKGY